MNFDINDFIKTNNPVCREERQYAAFLYSMFLNVMNNKGGKEEIKIVSDIIKNYDSIVHVFFEVSIMRDYFYALSVNEKTEFNKALLISRGITSDDIDVIPDSLGSPSKDWREKQNSLPRDKSSELQYARYMMRAKPDLMVLFTRGERKYVRIIECKYTQEEGRYKDCDGRLKIKQKEVQASIIAFLFGENGILKFDGETVLYEGDGVTEVDFEKKNDNGGEYVPKDKLITLVYKK